MHSPDQHYLETRRENNFNLNKISSVLKLCNKIKHEQNLLFKLFLNIKNFLVRKSTQMFISMRFRGVKQKC